MLPFLEIFFKSSYKNLYSVSFLKIINTTIAIEFSGADNRNRTGDLFLTKKVLYHLSYDGKMSKNFKKIPNDFTET